MMNMKSYGDGEHFVPVAKTAGLEVGTVLGPPMSYSDAVRVLKVNNVHGCVWSLYSGTVLYPMPD